MVERQRKQTIRNVWQMVNIMRCLERATNRYICCVNKIRNNESQETEVTEAWGLCRSITLLQDKLLRICTASVTINSHSQSN